jgi:hypothetical protein
MKEVSLVDKLMSVFKWCMKTQERVLCFGTLLARVARMMESVKGRFKEWYFVAWLHCQYFMRGMVRVLSKFCKAIVESIYSILVISFAASAILLVSWLVVKRFIKGEDIPSIQFHYFSSAQYWGQIGDFFGGLLNPILSFTAILLVLYTIRLQSKELREAREETRLANKTLAKQTLVFERQNFESVFFRMLEVHARLLADIDIPNLVKNRGRGAFVELSAELRAQCEKNKFNVAGIGELAEGFMSLGDNALAHYFRNMYQIFKMIDNTRFQFSEVGDPISARSIRRLARLNYEQKRSYANILRGQLSSYEMHMLFMNCLTPQGQGLKYYVEKFSVLKPLSKVGFLKGSQHCFEIFDEIAYMSSEDVSVEKIMKYDQLKRVSNVRKMIRV